MDSPPELDSARRPWWSNCLVGATMGAADAVPGVSGGTVALILGVYGRLLGALSRFDVTLLGAVRSGRFVDAWRRIDGSFLASLGAGILVGLKLLARTMSFLLVEHRTLTFAAFFGLILASGLLVARMAKPDGAVRTARCVALGLIAAAFAVWLMSQGRITPVDHLAYTFACGAIGICAMILPGISGAYLLLLMGKYEELTGILKSLPVVQSSGDLATLVVFAAGCLFGLLAFSRLLKWLLATYWSATMAVLSGFMIGSLYRVWPFQVDTTPDVEEFKLKIFQPAFPVGLDGEVIVCAAIGVGCFVGVLVVDWVARQRSPVAEARHEVADEVGPAAGPTP